MKGQVEHVALWDTVSQPVWSSCTFWEIWAFFP